MYQVDPYKQGYVLTNGPNGHYAPPEPEHPYETYYTLSPQGEDLDRLEGVEDNPFECGHRFECREDAENAARGLLVRQFASLKDTDEEMSVFDVVMVDKYEHLPEEETVVTTITLNKNPVEFVEEVKW